MPNNELLEFLRHLLDPAAYQKAEMLLRAMTDTSSTDESIRPDGTPEPLRGAQDGAYRYTLGSTDSFVKMRDLSAAQTETGINMAMDATSCFRQALTRMGVDARDVHPTALAEVYRVHRRSQRRVTSGGGDPRPYAAQDTRGAADFDRRFPNAARIKVM